MAKQRGIFKFEGPMGDRSYYMRDGKYYVRRKTMHKVDTDPRFENTHRKGLDFGTASRASKLLREALGHTVKPFSDTYMAGRMTARLVQAVAADQLHECGQRQVSGGNLSTLKGFEFNKHVSSLTLAFFPAVSIDSTTGKIKIALSHATTPQNISDAQLTIGITAINFQQGTYTPYNSIYPLSVAAPTEFQLDFPVDADPDREAAIIVTAGITYTAVGERVQVMIIADVFTSSEILAGTCTGKMEQAGKDVPLRDAFFQPCRLYGKNGVSKKCPTGSGCVFPNSLVVRSNSRSEKSHKKFMAARAPIRRIFLNSVLKIPI